MKTVARTPPFPAPENIKLESCSPESVLTDLDGSLELDGLELGPELQFLLESHLTPSPRHSDSHLMANLDKALCQSSPEDSRRAGHSNQAKAAGPRSVINITASSAQAGPAISLSACSADSKQDLTSTTDSRALRSMRPPRRAAAAAAALEQQQHAAYGSPAGPRGSESAAPAHQQSPMEDTDGGFDMDFDLLDSDCDKKPGQKRPRRRVVVETKDANGRPFTAAEIRRMKRRITNRESARRMRLKRQEEWGMIKKQARAMREEVQKMGSKVAALQAHCKTLEGEADRWQQLWRSAAASNAQLTQRIAGMQDGQSFDGAPMLPPLGKTGSEELMSPDALLNIGTGKPNHPGMPRAHSAVMPPAFHIRVDATPARRAPSAPEPLSPDLLRASSLPTNHPANTPTMAGALAALEEEARRFEDVTNRFEDDGAFASLFDGL